jgi:hypothetical protein
MANLETQCTTLLNAEYYSNKLNYYLGQGGKEGDNQVVSIGKVYKYDESTGEYTE